MAASLEFLLTVLIVGLLLAIFLIFLKMWRETRSKFSGGLALFAGVLLFKQLLTVLAAIEAARKLPIVGGRLQLLANVGEAIALAVLLYHVSR